MRCPQLAGELSELELLVDLATKQTETSKMIDMASPSEEVVGEVRAVDIFLHRINGLRPVYTCSEVTLRVEFMGETILDTDAARLDEIIELGASFSIEFDFSERDSYDKFISNPFVITITEEETAIDDSIVVSENPAKAIWHSDDSILDLQEALLGIQQEESTSKTVGSKTSKSKEGSVRLSKDKLAKSSKGSKGSKTGKESRSKLKTSASLGAAQSPSEGPKGPQIAGVAILDLLPIFLGHASFEETILLKEDSIKELDDRLRSVARLPTINIQVNINNPIPKGILYNITVESIYNLPEVMSPEMKYQVFFKLPGGAEVNFERYNYELTARREFTYKKWFGTDRSTLYVVRDDFMGAKNSLRAPLERVLTSDTPRVEYNTIKRGYGSEPEIECYELQLHRFGRIGMEVYVQKPEVMPDDVTKNPKTKGKDVKAKKGKADSVPETLEEPDYLHLMGYVDLCRLLYPGERSTRVLVPLRTHNYEEMEANTGLSDSKFRPKPPPSAESVLVTSEEENQSKKPTSKMSDKSSKSGKGKPGSGGNQADKLPPPQPPPEPSKLVYNEDGAQTFLVVELEFYEPLVKGRVLKDLHEDLHALLQRDEEKPRVLPAVIKSRSVTEEFYKNTVKELAVNIKQQYLEFVQIQKEKKLVEITELDFLKYVQRNGIYQTYLSAIVRATTMYVNSIFDVRTSHSTNEYHTFISNVYVTLVEQMNCAIQELFELGIGECKEPPSCVERLRRFAYEALELGATGLANRYFLQRICEDESDADGWYDYAIYHMHMGLIEMATECTREALIKNQTHKNSLALYSLLLARKKKISEAETCLLKATLDEPLWPEGWGVLYCLYVIKDSPEGMDVACEMGEKCLDLTPPCVPVDLSWSTVLVPNTFFYRTACYLIQLRLFEEAEIMIANEVIHQQAAINEYLLAVVNYYRGDYAHAILHIDNAFYMGGCDYTKCALRGHIFAARNDDDCALKEYKKVSEMYSQPDPKYLYMLFVRSGLCSSKLGNDQAARLNFLQACDIGGTAYTWLCVGVLYFHQHDFLSAEECLMLSNSLDNWMPETWAYLTLVNAKLGRVHEAQLCSRQAVEHKLQNAELIVAIEEAVDEMCK